jgi:4-hydroxy-3-methylbut-2-enyl diphosphate reductase
MIVEIDKKSGFCFGVIKAIEAADEALQNQAEVFSLGEIVHNNQEIARLEKKGLKTVHLDDIKATRNRIVLFRAHGEPPASYQLAKKQSHHLIDATCPVVLKLQQRIRTAYLKSQSTGGQIVLFGKAGHAEVIGLLGQTNGQGILVETEEDFHRIDFSRPIETFAQTTMGVSEINRLIQLMQAQMQDSSMLITHDTTCRQVSGRFKHLQQFAQQYDVIVFVGGKNSSNSKVLFQECLRNNPRSYFVSTLEDLNSTWFSHIERVGICGGTSTPLWLMQKMADAIQSFGNHS